MEQQKAEQDEQLLWAWLEGAKGLVDRLDGEPKRFLVEKEATIFDCLQASHVFFLGFPAVADGTIEASEQTVNWARGIDRRRTRALQTNQMAITLVVVLDTLIRELMDYLCRIPVASFAARVHSLKKKTTFYPSADERNGRQTWLSGLESLFRISIDMTVAEYLAEVVAARHTAAHRLLDDSQDTNGETVVDWYLAAKVLVWQLSGATQRLASE